MLLLRRYKFSSFRSIIRCHLASLRSKCYKHIAIFYAILIMCPLILPRVITAGRALEIILIISLNFSNICPKIPIFIYYWRFRLHTCLHVNEAGVKLRCTITATTDTREHVIKYFGHVSSILSCRLSRAGRVKPAHPLHYHTLCVCTITCSTWPWISTFTVNTHCNCKHSLCPFNVTQTVNTHSH